MGFSSGETMDSNQHLTYNRQKIHLHPTCYHDQPSSSAPTPPYRSQLLGDLDLFSTLLFDRQRAYRRPSDRTMPPRTRSTNEKEKRKVKGERVTKTLPAKLNTKLAESRVAKSLEVARETTSREEENDTTMVSNRKEAQEIQRLHNDLTAANARIKELEALLETRVTSRDPRIKQDNLEEVKDEGSARKDVTNQEGALLRVKNKKTTPLTIVPPLLTPQSPPLSAPAVSPCLGGTISSNEHIKTENIRAMYGKVKRKYDNLIAVARKLDLYTKSMDLSHFGEFGMYIKRLSECVEEDEQQQLQRQQQK